MNIFKKIVPYIPTMFVLVFVFLLAQLVEIFFDDMGIGFLVGVNIGVFLTLILSFHYRENK